MMPWVEQIPLPVQAWLPLGLAALAPLLLLAVVAPLSRRRARGIATVLALRTVVVLGVGFATLATVATVSVVHTGLRELRDRHETGLRALVRDLEAMPLGLAGANARLRLTLYQARAASVGFVAVGTNSCRSECLVVGDETAPDPTALKGRLLQSWPSTRRDEYFVRVGDRPYLLLSEAVHDAKGVAYATLVAGIDARYLADQATRTAWILLAISYALLVIVGWSSWQQLNSSLASRIHAITGQIQAGSVSESDEPLEIDGQELRELAESVSTYIQATLDEQRSSDERYRRLVELAPDGVIMCSAAGIKFANSAALALAGTRNRYDVIGRPIEKFLSFERGRAADPATGVLHPGRWRRLDGTELHVEIAEIADSSRDGVQQFVVRDVTDRRLHEADLAHRAEHDSLTGLMNRGRFESRLTHLLGPTGAPHGQLSRHVAVLFIDLDGFKPVNDRHGHAAGDAVLVAVAARLRESTRDSDLIARLGGDEFAVLLDVRDHEEVTAVANRILHALEQPVTFDGTELYVGASIGIADNRSVDAALVSLATGDIARSAAELLRAADVAMYAAKAGGGRRFGRGDGSLPASTEDKPSVNFQAMS